MSDVINLDERRGMPSGQGEAAWDGWLSRLFGLEDGSRLKGAKVLPNGNLLVTFDGYAAREPLPFPAGELFTADECTWPGKGK